MILGITGGFGCGKSTAARLFAERGYRHADSDQVIREKVLTAAPVLEALKTHFSDTVIDSAGTVNRPALAAIVFKDDSQAATSG